VVRESSSELMIDRSLASRAVRMPLTGLRAMAKPLSQRLPGGPGPGELQVRAKQAPDTCIVPKLEIR
jgi:hypothetical protein